MTSKYYRLDRILKKKADYNVIYGERGNGKTYAVQEYMLKQRLRYGHECMILRRWKEDIAAKNAEMFWDGTLVEKLNKMSNGKYSTIIYKAGVYYLGNFDDEMRPVCHKEDRLGYVWSVSESGRMKGQSYPKVRNILFDEFISLSDQGYIPGEVDLFINEVVTIARERTNVKVFLLGNTINPYNPYFEHFLIDPLKIKQGDIYEYEDPECGGKMAVEYCASYPGRHGKGTADKYAGFGSTSSRQMIIGGDWQLPFYPTCEPPEVKPEWTAYIEYKNQWMKFDIINELKKNEIWAYVSSTVPPESKKVPVFSLSQSRNVCAYILISHVDGENLLKSTLARIFNNKKIWFDQRLTGCWFENFLSEAQNTANQNIYTGLNILTK